MREVTIIGGGVAGLSLGLMLARNQRQVRIIEAGNYPRHKVCGEFLSGAGIEILNSMDLPLNVTFARSVLFASGKSIAIKQLPSPAVCLSRYQLDHALAKAFMEAGGKLQTNTRWTNGFANVIRATGRLIQKSSSGWRYLGLKAHALNVTLEADLELYFGRDYYVGLCRIEEGKVNVCGLFRSKSVWEGNPLERLRASANRLEQAKFIEESFCSVAGFAFQEELGTNDISIGDAFGMIPPFTGNGLSIALESAAIAAQHLDDGDINQALRKAFSSRVRTAKLLQKGMFSAAGIKLLFLALKLPGFWEKLFESTRSSGFAHERDRLLQHS